MALQVGTNSYVDVAEANAYFADSLQAEAWDDVEEPEQALVSAALRLEQIPFVGLRTSQSQPLAWPRAGVRDVDGRLIASDAVPARVKRAQMKLALAMSQNDLLEDTGLEGFESVQVGPINVRPRQEQRAGELPADVRRELQPFIRGLGSVRLVRS